jgi:hypothetical protein
MKGKAGMTLFQKKVVRGCANQGCLCFEVAASRAVPRRPRPLLVFDLTNANGCVDGMLWYT